MDEQVTQISRKTRTIAAVQDYLSISFPDFARSFLKLFTLRRAPLVRGADGGKIVLGYSNRTLFHTALNDLKNKKNGDIVVAVTPFHHTSYRDIIERAVKPGNIHILALNAGCNRITGVPDVAQCDLVVVTHPFGRDIDCSLLEGFKRDTHCLCVEDRVQGGSLDRPFSDPVFDISIYSTGMDKRPNALGGGFAFLRESVDFDAASVASSLAAAIEGYEKDTRTDRFLYLIKKVPTYFLYNVKFTSNALISFLRFFNLSFHALSKWYRNTNPGFAQQDYMRTPSQALAVNIVDQIGNFTWIEERFADRQQRFFARLPEEIRNEYFPWLDGRPLLTPYNAIRADDTGRLIDFLNKRYVAVIENPTYAVINHEDVMKAGWGAFTDRLVYLPSLANMDDDEIEYLADLLVAYHQDRMTSTGQRQLAGTG
jgi:hypothetical protein